MYILNISFMVSAPVHGNWYNFMTEKFIPTLNQEDFLKEIAFSRVLGEDIPTSFVYSLQMRVENIGDCVNIKNNILKEYCTFAAELFDTEVTHFATIMKILIKN